MQPSAKFSAPWWLWPTVLSADAPAVLVAWQLLIARVAGARLAAAEVVVLVLSVWLAYAADRWFEGWRLDPSVVRTHRHRFYQGNRWSVAVVWLAVLACDLAVAERGLSRAELRAGFALLVPVSVYLLSHQLVHRDARWRVPKEVCVALLLACGASLFAAKAAGIAAVAPACGLFAALCFTNCALISVWEDEVDLSHGQTSLALQLPAAGVLRSLPWVVAAAAALAWAAFPARVGAAGACATSSAVLLGAVDLAERRLGHRLARVLADAALLTPAVPLALGGFR